MNKVSDEPGYVAVPDEFSRVLAEDNHDRPLAYDFTAKRMLGNLSVQDKSVLEIGSGRGLLSLWLALQGARRVVSMEPELQGSRTGSIPVLRERIARLGLHQVEITTCDFQHFQPDDRFDIIVANASLNHVEESRRNALLDRETFQHFRAIASGLRHWLKGGGAAIIADASRYGLFTFARMAGLPKRLCYHCKTIDYQLHQNAGTWRRIFLNAGFRSTEIDYPVPYPLRHLTPFLNNAAANFCLQGSFILRAFTSDRNDVSGT